jgi:hypothetical protein
MMLLADDSSLFGDQPDPSETPWTPQRDLLGSERFAREFVVETENDGSAWLRFGDNQFGAAPITGQRLLARYRLGGGPRGNVGAEAISALVSDDANLMLGIQSLRNPLPAQGGADPETLDAIRLNAPEAFRTQERAVTTDDYARAAERHPDVQRAAARLRWTGSWYTVFLMLDRRAGKPVDADFKATMRAFLERFRLAGYDFEFADPVHVPLDIQLQVCVASGYFAADVKSALLRSVHRRRRPPWPAKASSTPTATPSARRSICRPSSPPPWPWPASPRSTSAASSAGGAAPRANWRPVSSPPRRSKSCVPTATRISLKTARSASSWRGDHEHFRQLRLLRRRQPADAGRRNPAPRPAGAGLARRHPRPLPAKHAGRPRRRGPPSKT